MDIPDELRGRNVNLANQVESYQRNAQGHSFGDYMPRPLMGVGTLLPPIGPAFREDMTLDQYLVHRAKLTFAHLLWDVVTLYAKPTQEHVNHRRLQVVGDKYSREFVGILQEIVDERAVQESKGMPDLLRIDSVADYFFRLYFTPDRILHELEDLSDPSTEISPQPALFGKLKDEFRGRFWTEGSVSLNHAACTEFQDMFKDILTGKVPDSYRDSPYLQAKDQPK